MSKHCLSFFKKKVTKESNGSSTSFFKSRNHPNQRTHPRSPGPTRRAACPLISHTNCLPKGPPYRGPPLNRPTIGSNRQTTCPLTSHRTPKRKGRATTRHIHCHPKSSIHGDPGDEGPLNPCPSCRHARLCSV